MKIKLAQYVAHFPFLMCSYEWMRKLDFFLSFPLTCIFIALETVPSNIFPLLDWIDFIFFRKCALLDFRMTYLFSFLEIAPSKSCMLFILTAFMHLSSFCIAFYVTFYIFLDLRIFIYFPLVSIYSDNSLGPQGPMCHLTYQAHVLGVKIK